MASRIPEPIARDLKDYAARVAPGVAIGIVDLDGRVHMVGPGLEALNAAPPRSALARPAAPAYQPFDLFSDVNQWMLKVLLAPRIPETLLNGPRIDVSGGAELARAAGVSQASGFRLVRHLLDAEFAERSGALRPARVSELLRRWQAANLKPPREIGMRWLIPGDADDQLRQALRRYSSEQQPIASPRRRGESADPLRPRVCLGLFAAADALGFGHVHGAARHVYIERLDPWAWDALGLAPAQPGYPIDVCIRVPRAPRSVFRGAVLRDGILMCDILQVWLDVAEHPARGREQAREIWRRVLHSVVDDGSVK
jgi:hypothetical protein